jgi:hypothetical protein
MPFKWSLLTDVSSAIKGTADVEQGIGKMADSLDQLGSETAATADAAADKLSSEFKTAFDQVQAGARGAGDKVGDDIHRGARRAEEGLDELKDSGRQNAIEVAASFDGSAQSIADGFQGLAAEMFAGFGPAGVAAGVAAAAGMGLISKSLEDAEEAAETAKENIEDLRGQLEGVGNDVSKLDAQGNFLTWSKQTTEGRTNLEWMNQAVRQLGISADVLGAAWQGNGDAIAQVSAALAGRMADLNEQSTASAASSGVVDEALQAQQRELTKTADVLKSYGINVQTAADQNKDAQTFLAGMTTATNDQATATKGLVDAQQAAQDAAQQYADALTDNLSVADEGLDRFVHKGKLNLKEWAKELRERRAENATIKDFTVDVDPKLSDKALANFKALPVETQRQIAEAYEGGSNKDKKRIRANLEAEAKVSKVTVDTSGAKVDPITVNTTIDTTVTAQQAAKAADAAQTEANKSGNAVTIKTRIDRDDLQRQVNRAAASITPPTITVKTRVQKEVP